MAAVEIPLDSSLPSYELTTTLDEEDYTFHVYWADRLESWFFDLTDANGDPIVSGQRIATNAALSVGFNDKIPGAITSITTDDNDDSDPGRDDLGNRVLVLYIPEADL